MIQQERFFSDNSTMIVVCSLLVLFALTFAIVLIKAQVIAQGERDIRLASMNTMEDINGRSWVTHLPFEGFNHSTAKMTLAISKGRMINDIQLHLRVQYMSCCNQLCIENFSVETDSLILDIGPNDYYQVNHQLNEDDFLTAYYTTIVDSALLNIIMATTLAQNDVTLRYHPVATDSYISMIITKEERKAMRDVLRTFWSLGGQVMPGGKLNYQYKYSYKNERN